jgi:hypothetical protein
MRGVIPMFSRHDIRHLGSYGTSFFQRTGAHGGSGSWVNACFSSKPFAGPECEADSFCHGYGTEAAVPDERRWMPEIGSNTGRALPAARRGGSSTRGAARRLPSDCLTNCERGHATTACSRRDRAHRTRIARSWRVLTATPSRLVPPRERLRDKREVLTPNDDACFRSGCSGRGRRAASARSVIST